MIPNGSNFRFTDFTGLLMPTCPICQEDHDPLQHCLVHVVDEIRARAERAEARVAKLEAGIRLYRSQHRSFNPPERKKEALQKLFDLVPE